MVGSVLMQRMSEEKDFDHIDPVFFSTSNAGGKGPSLNGRDTGSLNDANSIADLKKLDIIITCQGGDYTKAVHPRLRAAGWKGYWIDAASALRMEDDAVIVLDPLNLAAIKNAVAKGVTDYIGGNCTVSLMLMGMHGLFKADLVEWATAMTYQAASGAGAANMRELLLQMGAIHGAVKPLLDDPASAIIDIDRRAIDAMRAESFPRARVWLSAGRQPAAVDLHGPRKRTIQGRMEGRGRGQQDSRPDRRRHHSDRRPVRARGNHALPQPGTDGEAPARCAAGRHRSASGGRESVGHYVVPNNKEATLADLTPAKVTGTLGVPIGRLRKLNMGPRYLSAFTVGDQLLWGAAEPLRRMLRILLARPARITTSATETATTNA